jgi:PAS domain-containing protein
MSSDAENSAEYLNTINLLKNENATLRTEIQALQSIESTDATQLSYKEGQLRFQTIFELSKLGNKVITADLKITQINPAMVALLCLKAKMKFLELVSSTIRQKLIMQAGKPYKSNYGKSQPHPSALKPS